MDSHLTKILNMS